MIYIIGKNTGIINRFETKKEVIEYIKQGYLYINDFYFIEGEELIFSLVKDSEND